MSRTPAYPELDQLFGAYLNQDYSYWGDTLEAVVEACRRDSSPENVQALADEIDAFSVAHAHDLDEAFSQAWGFDFDPSLWNHTTTSFLAALRAGVAAPGGVRQ